MDGVYFPSLLVVSHSGEEKEVTVSHEVDDGLSTPKLSTSQQRRRHLISADDSLEEEEKGPLCLIV